MEIQLNTYLTLNDSELTGVQLKQTKLLARLLVQVQEGYSRLGLWDDILSMFYFAFVACPIPNHLNRISKLRSAKHGYSVHDPTVTTQR